MFCAGKNNKNEIALYYQLTNNINTFLVYFNTPLISHNGNNILLYMVQPNCTILYTSISSVLYGNWYYIILLSISVHF